MLCVLRVLGDELNLSEVQTLVSAKPYRVDKAGVDNKRTNGLYYDIAQQEAGSFSGFLSLIFEWLTLHTEIAALRDRKDVREVDLDIGVFVDQTVMGSWYTIDQSFLEIAARLGVSITISVYRSGAEEIAAGKPGDSLAASGR